MLYLILLIPLVLGCILLFWNVRKRSEGGTKSTDNRKPIWVFTPEYKRAGIRGEKQIQAILNSVMRDGDRCFSNLKIEIEDKETELDFVIVNKYGVYIIEVKNYTGTIYGNEDDYEWIKYKTTEAGNTYGKCVKNPIRQVKRQIYILSRYLDYYGANTWIRGYAILLQCNSPVDSPYVLNSIEELDRAIHTVGKRMLDLKTIDKIVSLLD